jgi:hypothetical protein
MKLSLNSVLWIKNIRPFLGAISMIGFLTLAPISAYAQEATVAVPAASGGNQSTRIEMIKSRGDAEITRRLTSLNSTLTRLGSIKNISSTDKATLSGNIQTDITNLTALKTKIDADTDLTTLKTDVSGIVKDYRVYLVFLPQTRIAVSGDAMTVVVQKLTTLSGQLSTRLATAQAAGKDVSSLQSLLADLNAKTTDAQNRAIAAESEVLPLTPAGYPGNVAILKDARAKIKVGVTDLKTARSDAQQIIQGLGK